MGTTDLISNYIRFLKRLNYSAHTVKYYSSVLKNFSTWLDVPIAGVTNGKILEYVDYLLERKLKPKSINCHLATIRGFYDYLHHEEGIEIANPVKHGYSLRVPRPLPRPLNDHEIKTLFDAIRSLRDQAMFRIMLRCGLRVKEAANLTVNVIDFERKEIAVRNGKWGRDRIVFMSSDASQALKAYLNSRPAFGSKRVFLVEKGLFKNKPLSVRGIQKRIEYYARKTSIAVSCHRLRHTMATQLLNADARPVTIQELLGHDCIRSIEGYCKVSSVKVKRDYFKAMEIILSKI